MAGMTTTGASTVSDYKGRSVIIEVSGVARQDIFRTSNYRMKVAYSQMSETIRNITRMGGKIVSVTVAGTDAINDAPPQAQAPSPEQNSDG